MHRVGGSWDLRAGVGPAGWESPIAASHWAGAAYIHFLQAPYLNVSFGAVYVLITSPSFPWPSDVDYKGCGEYHVLNIQPTEYLSLPHWPITPNNLNSYTNHYHYAPYPIIHTCTI